MLGYSECPGFPKDSLDVDFSNFEFDLDDEGFIVINGNFTVLRDIEAPYPLLINSERLERGEWHPGILNRKIDSFCARLQNPTETWYPFTRQMKLRKCPFPRGHVETVRNLRLTNFPFVIPPSFIGEWKIYSESRLESDPKGNCTMLEFIVLEI